MASIRSQLKQLRIRRLFTTVALGIVLLLNVACSSGSVQATRPGQPSMQMTEGKSAGKAVKSSIEQQARKASKSTADGRDVKVNASDMSYRGSDVPQSSNPDIGPVQQTSLPPLPNPKQPMIDRADPNSKVLERAGEAIQSASAFLKNTAESASARPESQANPALGQ